METLPLIAIGLLFLANTFSIVCGVLLARENHRLRNELEKIQPNHIGARPI